MESISIDLASKWIKEIESSLPRPIEEINRIISNKANEENVSEEILQAFAENLNVLNIIKFNKNEEKKIEQKLAEIKGIIYDKRTNDIGCLLQIINEMKIEFFGETDLEIREFTRNENYSGSDHEDIGNQISKFEREIFSYLKSTPNKLVSAYTNSIIQEFSVLFETYLKDIKSLNEAERQDLDFDYECLTIFRNKIENQYSFTPSSLCEIFIEDFMAFLHKKLLEVINKDVNTFLSDYRFQVSKLWYITNSEAKLHKANSLTNFKEIIRKKYGWISHEVEIKIILKLKKETNQIWLENGFDNRDYIWEVKRFAKMQIADILNGNLKLFQNGQENSQEFKVAASKILREGALKNSDSQICQLKIDEISQFLDFSFCENSHLQNPPNIFCQSKENMLFFLFHATLLTSSLHIVACPDLSHILKRESQIEDFEWLRTILELSFKFSHNKPTYFTREDNPILICKKMLKVIIPFLYKALKLKAKTEIHNILSESLKSYLYIIKFKNNRINESETIKKNFTKIKEGNSAVVTICISGWLSAKDNKHEGWFHVGELLNQGLTYDFKWKSGHLIDAILKIGFNVFTWLPLPIGFYRYKTFGQGVLKPLIIGSGIKSAIKRPIFEKFQNFVDLSRKDLLIPISSIVDYLAGCPFQEKAREAENAGKLLAEIINSGAFGNSKINLICFSLAAEVVYHCLLNISAEKANTINHVILMGGASSKNGDWAKCRQIVKGRMICVYCKTDQILRYLYRASQLTEPIGLGGIDVEGVENFDVTGTVSGHLDYRDKMDLIFHSINYFGS